jgi:glycosyltransferase involved in cell wall biosynthesis
MLSADRTLRLAHPGFVRQTMEQADIVQVEHPWQVPTIARWNARRRPLVMVAHNAEAAIAQQLGCPRREIEAIRRREGEALAASDGVIVFTNDDRARLCELPAADPTKLHVIPLGVDADRIRPATPDEKARAKAALGLEKKRVALFVGSLYGPNVEAAREVFRIAEALDRTDVVFVIAGRVGERFQSNERVLVTGEVEDVSTYFAAADLAVNPMKSGGGMQVKLLECLAAALPCVTTALGMRGLEAVPDRDLLVTETGGFSEVITKCLSDESRAGDLGRAGRRLVERRYSWKVIGRERADLYQALLAQRPQR